MKDSKTNAAKPAIAKTFPAFHAVDAHHIEASLIY
jgi:hypothetical protein